MSSLFSGSWKLCPFRNFSAQALDLLLPHSTSRAPTPRTGPVSGSWRERVRRTPLSVFPLFLGHVSLESVGADFASASKGKKTVFQRRVGTTLQRIRTACGPSQKRTDPRTGGTFRKNSRAQCRECFVQRSWWCWAIIFACFQYFLPFLRIHTRSSARTVVWLVHPYADLRRPSHMVP